MKNKSILNRCLLVLLSFIFTSYSFAQLTSTHITSFSPTSGTAGTLVAIRGSGFTGTTHVRFGVTAAQSFTVLSDTVITARVGAGSSGRVFVSGSHGQDSLAGFTYINPPPLNFTHITSFSPTSGTTGTSVFILGVGFTGTTSVKFGVTAAQSFTVLSDTVITARVGTGSSGKVFVSGSHGQDSLAGFTYTPLTSTHITSFSPTSGSTGTAIAIRGVGFTGTTSVKFGVTAAQSFTVLSDTMISAIVGTGSSGPVFVSGSRGFDSLAGFTYTPPTPTHIRSFSPTSGTTGTSVFILGSGFTGTTSVRFGVTAAQSFFILSDTMIRAIVGTGSSGNVFVSGSRGFDSLAGFTYTPPLTSTHITSFSPTSGTTGTSVFILGSGFTGTTSVRFGVTAAQSFTILSDTMISAIVGTGSSGPVFVSGSHGFDSLAGFTYTPPTPTHITSFSPTSGSTGTAIAIRGVGFTGTSSVSFGSTAAQSFTILSDTAITAIVGTGSSGSVFVSGSQGFDSLAGFTYTPPSTSTHITSFSPTSGTTGTSVFILGSGFTGTSSVSFGSTAAQSFTVLSDTAITAIVGTGSSGSVFVSGSQGFDSLAGFTYTPPLTYTHITSFSPTSGTTGTSVFILGSGFTGTTSVSFGSTAAQSFTVLSDTAITAIVDSGSSGPVFVSGSHGFDSLAGFTYIATPGLLTQLTALSVYPNPANGVLFVTVPKTAVASRFQLTDISGKIARSVKVEPHVTNVKINIAGLDKGIYKLTWSDGVNYSYQTILILK